MSDTEIRDIFGDAKQGISFFDIIIFFTVLLLRLFYFVLTATALVVIAISSLLQ
jgi:hypothetical protein